MRINHNISALNTYRQLTNNTQSTSKSLEKLSSGYRINRAGDDAAGLAISEKMRAQIRGLDQATRNSQDTISMVQTAEGALNETHSILQRMEELATQAANDTYVDSDRNELQKEINQLTSEINRIGNTTEFNTQRLLNGGDGKTGNIRYSILKTGDPATGSAAGTVSALNVATSSIKAGTGVVGNFTTTNNSKVAADDGEIGSPFLAQTHSVLAGTGAMSTVTTLGTGGIGTINSVTTTPAAAPIAAVDNYKVTTNFVAGDTVTINGRTYTAGAGAGEFAVGATIADSVTNLVGVINADTNITDDFIVSSAGDTFTLTESNTTDGVVQQAGVAAFTGTGVIAANPAQTAGTAGTAGRETVTVTGNMVIGNTFTIAGQTFTAVKSGAGNSASTFEVGATATDTRNNLVSALNLNTNITGTYTVAAGAGDSLTVTETNSHDGVASNAGHATLGANQSSRYAFEITQNFTAGDKLTIGTREYTAGTDFVIGDTIADTVSNIKTAIEASNDANDTAYDITLTDPTWTGSTDNNILVFTAKVAGLDANAANMGNSHIDRTAAVNGVYKFEVKVNFEAGQKLKVGDVELTAGSANSTTTFKIGASIDETASNIHDALVAAKAAPGGKLANYNIGAMGTGIDADTITLTEAAATGVDLTLPTVTDVDAQAGKYSFDLTTNFSTGDKISIDGVDFVAGTDFTIGGDVSATATNLKTAINANVTLSAKYTATTGNTTFVNGNKIILEEKVAGIDGVDMAAPSVTNAIAQKGSYEFLVTNNFADRDRIVVGGQSLIAGTDFQVGANADETASKIVTAINNNTTLKAAYTASVAGNKITLNEKTATGTNLVAPTVSVGAVAGQFEFSMNSLAKGSNVTIDGTKLTFATGGTEAETAAELKTLVEGNTTLNAKYSVEVEGSNVKMTQKAGQESATAPILSYQTVAGSGFSAMAQIGANSGQSLTVDLKDMRSLAIGVSSSTGAAGQTVEVDGKQYAVAWTSATSVTNGTDNVSVEYGLDISTHDNATAAIKVINTAINTVSSERSKLGAYQNRLEHTINNLGTSSENLTASESRIRDVDMAKEMMEYTKNNILTQAAQAMLAQANQQPQGVLQLLR